MTNLNDIKNYTYVKELGVGITGYVSLAQHKHTNQFYAIKCFQLRKRILTEHIPRDFYLLNFSSVLSKSDFNDEVRLHTLFNSKNVGPILYASWIENGLGYMVLEVWDRHLENGETLTEKEYSKIKNQIQTIHKCGYLHLDIKSDNILVKLDQNNEIIDITITDFGLMPVSIRDALEKGAHFDVCNRLKYFPNKPEDVDMKLLEIMKTQLNIS